MNVIITGASKGIGKAVAGVFAESGDRLLLCARTGVLLEQTVNILRTSHPSCEIYARAADLSVKEEVIEFGNWCLQYGVPDVLVNNAGQFIAGGIADEPAGNLEKLMAVNLYSAYHLTRVLLPAMIGEKPPGEHHRHIFNLCSIASLQAYPNGGAYSISKYALDGFSRNLREELKSRYIKVTAVYPGAVMTDTWGSFDNSQKRIMEAKDVASMIHAASRLSPQAVVEDIVMRPILGDL